MSSWRYSISKGSNHPFKFIFCAINVLKTNKNAVPLGYFFSRGTLSPREPADPFWACLKSGGEFGIAVFDAWVFLLDDLMRGPNTPWHSVFICSRSSVFFFLATALFWLLYKYYSPWDGAFSLSYEVGPTSSCFWVLVLCSPWTVRALTPSYHSPPGYGLKRQFPSWTPDLLNLNF